MGVVAEGGATLSAWNGVFDDIRSIVPVGGFSDRQCRMQRVRELALAGGGDAGPDAPDQASYRIAGGTNWVSAVT